MKRLGKITKTIYPDGYDFSQCPECCTLISDEDAENEEFIATKHLTDLIDCIGCLGCPAAKNNERII